MQCFVKANLYIKENTRQQKRTSLEDVLIVVTVWNIINSKALISVARNVENKVKMIDWKLEWHFHLKIYETKSLKQ